MSKNEVAVKESSAVALAEGYGDFEGAGFENQGRDDMSIPFISVLQGLSPQLETFEDAKAGMLFNTVTEERVKGADGMLFVPATTQHVYVEYVPRDNGGGFVGIHEINSDVVRKAKEESTEFGKYMVGENELIETFYIYGVLCNETDPLGMAVLAFTSTKIKVYKKFSTKCRTFRVKAGDRMVSPPLFAHLTRVGTVKETNKNGDFYNFQLSPAMEDLSTSLLAVDDPRFQAAVECKKMVESGVAKAAHDSVDGAEAKDDDIPF